MGNDSNCIFCAISERIAPAEVIDADDHTVAFLDVNPATEGHVLVIPRIHSRNLYEVSDADLLRTVVMAKRIARQLRDKLGADGVNILNSCESAAWQTVWHFHIHVIPRYNGDPLKLPWVPSGVQPEQLQATAALLR